MDPKSDLSNKNALVIDDTACRGGGHLEALAFDRSARRDAEHLTIARLLPRCSSLRILALGMKVSARPREARREEGTAAGAAQIPVHTSMSPHACARKHAHAHAHATMHAHANHSGPGSTPRRKWSRWLWTARRRASCSSRHRGRNCRAGHHGSPFWSKRNVAKICTRLLGTRLLGKKGLRVENARFLTTNQIPIWSPSCVIFKTNLDISLDLRKGLR